MKLNVDGEITFNAFDNVTFSNDAQFVNTAVPNVVTLSGIVISVIALPLNAILPIDVTVSGIVTFVRP